MLLSAVCLSLFIAQGQARDARVVPAGTGVIRGRVFSAATGVPLRDATVTLLSDSDPVEAQRDFKGFSAVRGGPSGDSISVRFRTATSDAAGRFEFSGLPASGYRLIAMAGPNRGRYLPAGYAASRLNDAGRLLVLAAGQTISDANIGLVTASAIEGRVVDDTGEPVTAATVTAARLTFGSLERASASPSETDDLGRFRIYGLEPGTYVVAAESGRLPSPTTGSEEGGLVTTYHPSSINDVGASKVQVALSQDLLGIDIQLVRSRRYTVAGTIINSQGQPLSRANAMLVRPALGGYSSTQVTVNDEGRFTLLDVVPGDYELEVRDAPDIPSLRVAEFAHLAVTVSSDLENLVVVTQPGSTVAGRVVFAEVVTGARRPVTVNVYAMQPRTSQTRVESVNAVDPDFRFTLKDLFGPKLLRLAPLPSGWALSAVLLGGRDITDVPTVFRPEHDGQLQMVVTTRTAVLEGMVKDERGAVATDATVLVFPEERASWTGSSHRLRSSAVDEAGHFVVRGLPAGRYIAIAVARGGFRVPRNASEEFFAMLSAEGIDVVLDEDETRTANLRLSYADVR